MTHTDRPEAAAVRHVLSGPTIASRCEPYLSGEEIDWNGLFAAAETMSGGERLLVSVASDIATKQSSVALWELTERLARPTFERVLEALELARGDGLADPLRALPRAA
jgi:energy-coupling factor transporter ATP-binding protein EcfA2